MWLGAVCTPAGSGGRGLCEQVTRYQVISVHRRGSEWIIIIISSKYLGLGDTRDQAVLYYQSGPAEAVESRCGGG